MKPIPMAAPDSRSTRIQNASITSFNPAHRNLVLIASGESYREPLPIPSQHLVEHSFSSLHLFHFPFREVEVICIDAYIFGDWFAAQLNSLCPETSSKRDLRPFKIAFSSFIDSMPPMVITISRLIGSPVSVKVPFVLTLSISVNLHHNPFLDFQAC